MGLCGSWVKSKVNGGVWKVMCGGENLEKKKYIYIYILLCRYIILMSRIGKLKLGC